MNSNITVRVVFKNYLKEEKKTRQKGHTKQKARTKKNITNFQVCSEFTQNNEK